MLALAPRVRATLGSDRAQVYDAPVGGIAINPANVDSSLTWSSTRENAVIALTPESLLELAAHEFDVGCADLQPPPFGTVDPWALQIAKLLKAELTQPEPPNELYVDSLITVFGIHLLRNYAEVRKLLPIVRGGLSVRSARRVEEFLNENFSRKLSVAELAAVSGLTPRYFIEAFTRTFGERPHQYLVRRRLAFAEELLLRGNLAIDDVAQLSGFSSQSHLTSLMERHRKMTPMQLRRGR